MRKLVNLWHAFSKLEASLFCQKKKRKYNEEIANANQASKGHLVDALALRGDEGRGTLR